MTYLVALADQTITIDADVIDRDEGSLWFRRTDGTLTAVVSKHGLQYVVLMKEPQAV